MKITKTHLRTIHARGMNKLEESWSSKLEMRRRAGIIVEYGFERIRLSLANGAWYKPDFDVLLADGSFQFHEVKGYWREAARVRTKVAADRFWMFKFLIVMRNRAGEWTMEEVK